MKFWALRLLQGLLILLHADGMLDPSNKDNEDLPLTIRAVFIIGPDKKLKLSLNYPASVGRNMVNLLNVQS